MIVVCSLARLSDTVREHRARHVVSLLKDGDKVFRPEGVGPRDHLGTFFNIHRNVGFFDLNTLGAQQGQRARAIRAERLGVDFNFCHQPIPRLSL